MEVTPEFPEFLEGLAESLDASGTTSTAAFVRGVAASARHDELTPERLVCDLVGLLAHFEQRLNER